MGPCLLNIYNFSSGRKSIKAEIFFNSYLIIKNVAGLLDPTTHVLLYEKKSIIAIPGFASTRDYALTRSARWEVGSYKPGMFLFYPVM